MNTGTVKPDLLKALGTVDRNRALLDRAHSGEFHQVGERKLTAWIFSPPDWTASDLRPAMLFFHGSLWDKGLVSQFAPQALYFAERGMVTILFEYRLPGVEGVDGTDALEDVATAHRWTCEYARDLGVDPGRIVMAGASAGAWMAAVRSLGLAALKPEAREQSPPVAMVLFEPICEVAGKFPWAARFQDPKSVRKLVPRKMLTKGAPPALIFHGSSDPIVPFELTAKLAKTWISKVPAARFIPYEGAGHGFYNFNVDMRLYENTLNATDDFLVGLGLLRAGDSLVAL
jgi:acetyl esterase/lipase